jgi:TM2 domain-containing membrane protein YozV
LSPQKTEPSRVPAVAALLTWFVPGAGHVYLGCMGFALAAFLVVEGLFFLGVRLSDGLLFEYLQADLRTPLAPMLAPETGNLGALLWMRREHPYLAPLSAQPWPSTMQLGALLTAISGVLNLCLVVAAHRAALESGPRLTRAATPSGNRPALAVLCAWLVPGLGHWLSGRKLRGALVFVLLIGLFVLGTLLAEGSNLDRERHFFYWGGQVFLGLLSKYQIPLK